MVYLLVWVQKWLVAAVAAALALEILAAGDLSVLAAPEGLVRRAVAIFLGGVELAIVWKLLDHTRHWVVEHLKHLPEGDRMAPWTRRQVLGVLARQVAIAAVLLLSFGPVTWAVAEAVLWPLGTLEPLTLSAGSILGWWGPAGAVAVTGFSLWVGIVGGFDRIRVSARIHGRRLAGAMLRMVHLRALGPVRDFFEFVPVIRSLPTLALAAVVWADAPHPAAGWISAGGLVAATALNTVLGVLPPVWVFFSSSRYYQFEVFRILRYRWAPRNGITLLDRFGRAHGAVYESERRIVERMSPLLAALYRDPTAPRVWSIRSGAQYWENVAFYLIRMCPLIVVDSRGEASVPVVKELRSILYFGLLHRTVILGARSGDASGLHEILREEGEAGFAARVVTEEELIAAGWDGDRLVLSDFSVDLRDGRGG